jgi:hypothetical protein
VRFSNNLDHGLSSTGFSLWIFRSSTAAEC